MERNWEYDREWMNDLNRLSTPPSSPFETVSWQNYEETRTAVRALARVSSVPEFPADMPNSQIASAARLMYKIARGHKTTQDAQEMLVQLENGRTADGEALSREYIAKMLPVVRFVLNAIA